MRRQQAVQPSVSQRQMCLRRLRVQRRLAGSILQLLVAAVPWQRQLQRQRRVRVRSVQVQRGLPWDRLLLLDRQLPCHCRRQLLEPRDLQLWLVLVLRRLDGSFLQLLLAALPWALLGPRHLQLWHLQLRSRLEERRVRLQGIELPREPDDRPRVLWRRHLSLRRVPVPARNGTVVQLLYSPVPIGEQL
eukprot:Amastigsp_a510961_115.p4 type:complete len:189 gc:universal Amastigsp_a510961_115:1774-1208(-)